MSTSREYAYRIDVTARAEDGSWWELAWTVTDVQGVQHEAACYWHRTLGEARRAWDMLDAGQNPRELDGDLSGWAGLVISPVQIWVRFRNADGWGPWKRHETWDEDKQRWEPATVEGTREIRTGVLAVRVASSAAVRARMAELIGDRDD